ncbi:MAG: hypothetical protein FJ253_04620 [Phycisphaerae bacterium]|nr:hypothetical protein [Phycisphaerae bacterium]
MKRLNTKFVVVIAAFLAVALGGLGVVVVYKVMRDPSRNIEQGRELERQGDYRGASKAYGRAVFKRRTNLEYMDLMRGALLKIVPETMEEARQHYETNLNILRQRASPNPADPAPWVLLIDELAQRAHFLTARPAWQTLYDAGVDMAKAVPAGGEPEAIALTTQAYALAMGELDLPTLDRDRVENGVKQALELDAKNEMAWEAYLTLLVTDINRLVASNQQITADQRRKELGEALVKADTDIPNSSVPAKIRTRLVRSKLARHEISMTETVKELEPLVDRLVEVSAAPGAHRRVVLNAAEQLLALGQTEHTERAVALLDRWIEANPDDLTARRLLSICLRSVDPERALSVARGIVDAPPRTVSLEAAFREEIRADAMERIFDVEIGRADGATTPEEKAKHVASAKAERDRLAELSRNQPDEPRLLKADAKLAMLAGDYMTAAAKLERVIAVSRAPEAEVFMLAADAAARRGELGLSLDLLNRGVDVSGATYPLLLTKARVELQLRRSADAVRTANLLLAYFPEDVAAKEVLGKAQSLQKAVSLEGSDDPLVKSLLETERMLGERNFDGARRAIDRLMKDGSTDPRVLSQAARLEIATGNDAKAVTLLDQALAVAPNDAYIIQLRAIADTRDPLERIDKLAELTSQDEAQRAGTRYLMTIALVANLKRDVAAGGRGSDGRIRNLDELKKTLANAEAAIPALRDAAVAAAPYNPGVLGAQFDEAVLARDLEKAVAIGKDAERNGNPLMGLFLQARALTQLLRFDEAIAALDRAKQQGLASAELSRQLAETREAMGQMPEALTAYQDAYNRRPYDRVLIERYTDALRRAGEVQRALTIYRDVANAATGDRTIINTWLRFEDLYGDRSLALCWRRKFYREFPFDRENGLALASLLTDGKADPRLLVDEQCRQKYSEGEWVGLPPAQKQTEMEAMLKSHRQEAEAIFRSLLTSNPGDFEAALVQAQAMSKIGLVADGEKVLRSAIAKAPADSAGPMWFALGQYLDKYDRTADAVSAFEEAKKHQDPKLRDGELALSDYWFDKGQWQRAYDALKPVLEARADDINIEAYRRMAEICQRLRRFDEGRKALERGRGSQSAEKIDAQYELLLGGIELGAADDAWSRGDKQAGERHFEQGLAAMRRSSQTQPGSALPWIGLAAAERNRFTRTGDTRALDQAITYADKALSLAGAYFPAVRLKSELHLDKEDMVGSIQAVERYIQLVPDSIEGRRLLAERHLRNNNVTRALGVLAEGAALSPNEAIWYQAIGELESRRGNGADATRAFDRALEIAPSSENLRQALEQRLRQATPDWQGIVVLARKYPEEVRKGPAAQSILAAALVQTGDRENGLQALRRAGRFVREEMAAGRATAGDLDVWYRALREIFPVPRTVELEAFVKEVFSNQLVPDDQRWLAGLWSETGKEGEPNARKYLEQAIAAADSMDSRYRARVWLISGNLAYLRDDCSGAIASFEKAILEDPDDSMSLNNLAYLLGECTPNLDRALEMSRRAVRINPTQPYFLDTFGVLLIKNNEAEAAIGPLSRSASLLPSASSLAHLAKAYHLTGRKDDAKAALEKAATLQPDEKTAAEIAELRATLG